MSGSGVFKGGEPSEGAASPGDALLNEILGSASFRKASSLRSLLAYLWKNRSTAVSEYAIAVEALGRRADFDPSTDATVRVHIARLRQKLKDYYATEGARVPLVITIPVGEHQLRLERVEEAAARCAVELHKNTSRMKRLALPMLALAALAGISLSLYLKLENLRLKTALHAQELPPLWRLAVGNGRPTMLVYPNPVFYQWGPLRVRDIRINEFEPQPQSEVLRELAAKLGPPVFSQSFSIATDTLAAVLLTKFLESRGVPLTVGDSRHLSLEFYGSHNLILLGIPHTSRLLQKYLTSTTFHVGEGHIANRQPRPAEQHRYVNGGGRVYGLVTLVPGHAQNCRLLLLSGLNTAALASLLTSPVSLEFFQRYWASQGSPEYFEALIEAELSGQTITRAKPVAFRSIQATSWKHNATLP